MGGGWGGGEGGGGSLAGLRGNSSVCTGVQAGSYHADHVLEVLTIGQKCYSFDHVPDVLLL